MWKVKRLTFLLLAFLFQLSAYAEWNVEHCTRALKEWNEFNPSFQVGLLPEELRILNDHIIPLIIDGQEMGTRPGPWECSVRVCDLQIPGVEGAFPTTIMASVRSDISELSVKFHSTTQAHVWTISIPKGKTPDLSQVRPTLLGSDPQHLKELAEGKGYIATAARFRLFYYYLRANGLMPRYPGSGDQPSTLEKNLASRLRSYLHHWPLRGVKENEESRARLYSFLSGEELRVFSEKDPSDARLFPSPVHIREPKYSDYPWLLTEFN